MQQSQDEKDAEKPAQKPAWSITKKIWAIVVSISGVFGLVYLLTSVLPTCFTPQTTLKEGASTSDSQNASAGIDAPPAKGLRLLGELAYPRTHYRDNSSNFYVDWKIPVDAPLETFPEALLVENGYFVCGPEQFDWLDRHAIAGESEAFDLKLHNIAGTGGAVSLTNLRFDGREKDSVALVYFSCPLGGRGAGPRQNIIIGTDGRAAVWGESYGEGGMPEGSIATINLGPGESDELRLLRSPDVDLQRLYQGRFLADIVGDSAETVILAENVEFLREPVPGFFFGYGAAGFRDGKLRCGLPESRMNSEGSARRVQTTEPHICSLSEGINLLRLASEAAR